MSQTLIAWLVRDGYNLEDMNDVVAGYRKGGIDSAVAAFAWADDADHDYTGELRGVIEQWEEQR